MTQKDALTAAMMDDIKVKHVGAREVARYMVQQGNQSHLTEDDLFYSGMEYELVKDDMQRENDRALCQRIMSLGDHVVDTSDREKVRRVANRMFDRAVARFKDNPGADNYSFLDVAMMALQHAEKNLKVAYTK